MKNKILDLIESKEVRACIDENFDKLSKKQIIDIIYGSPYSLQQKYDIMNQLAKNENDCERPSYSEYSRKLNIELHNLNLNEDEIFVLELKRLPKYGRNLSATYSLGVFSDIEQVIKLISTKFIIDKQNCWYVLSKFKLNDNENKSIIKYFISADGIILFSDCFSQMKYDYCVQNTKISIPLPFKVGDIILIDSSPFAYPMYGLVVEIDSKIEGAHIKCLYIDIFGNINIHSLEDFSVFENHAEIPLPSPLYRSKTFTGELTGNDKKLITIGKLLKENKNAAKIICDFVFKYKIHEYYSNLKWETFYTEIINEIKET